MTEQELDTQLFKNGLVPHGDYAHKLRLLNEHVNRHAKAEPVVESEPVTEPETHEPPVEIVTLRGKRKKGK